MTAKRVLSVGQCPPDHAALCQLVEGNFDATVVPADLPDDTFEALRRSSFDLILVNRKLDADYSDGLEIILKIKANAALAAVPCMLVTNFEEHQQQAVAKGAELGFGKNDLADPATVTRLARFLVSD